MAATPTSPMSRHESYDINNPPSTKQNILNLFTTEIAQAEDEKTMVFPGVDKVTAEEFIKDVDLMEAVAKRICYNSLLKSLKIVVRFNIVHECHLPWMTDNLKLHPQHLEFSENERLRILSSPRFDGFLAPYASTIKEPDACVLPKGSTKPTLVVESGWSESRTELHHDRDVWLNGGAASTEIVLILKWSRLMNRKVKGDIEVWARDTNTGLPCLLQQEEIFPKPPPQNATFQFVKIKKNQLFGQVVENGNADVKLTVDSLRKIADEYIRAEGYIPA